VEKKQIMALILRYTENAVQDLKHGYSYHQIQPLSIYEALVDLHDGLSALEVASKLLDIDVDELEVKNGIILQALSGLCGFELDSENIEDAIEEAMAFRYNHVYNTKEMPFFAIYEGSVIEGNEEGVLFRAKSILYSQNQK